jgi:hypothetical protein
MLTLRESLSPRLVGLAAFCLCAMLSSFVGHRYDLCFLSSLVFGVLLGLLTLVERYSSADKTRQRVAGFLLVVLHGRDRVWRAFETRVLTWRLDAADELLNCIGFWPSDPNEALGAYALLEALKSRPVPRLGSGGYATWLAQTPLLRVAHAVELARQGRWPDVLVTLADRSVEESTNPVVRGLTPLLRAWANSMTARASSTPPLVQRSTPEMKGCWPQLAEFLDSVPR